MRKFICILCLCVSPLSMTGAASISGLYTGGGRADWRGADKVNKPHVTFHNFKLRVVGLRISGSVDRVDSYDTPIYLTPVPGGPSDAPVLVGEVELPGFITPNILSGQVETGPDGARRARFVITDIVGKHAISVRARLFFFKHVARIKGPIVVGHSFKGSIALTLTKPLMSEPGAAE